MLHWKSFTRSDRDLNFSLDKYLSYDTALDGPHLLKPPSFIAPASILKMHVKWPENLILCNDGNFLYYDSHSTQFNRKICHIMASYNVKGCYMKEFAIARHVSTRSRWKTGKWEITLASFHHRRHYKFSFLLKIMCFRFRYQCRTKEQVEWDCHDNEEVLS